MCIRDSVLTLDSTLGMLFDHPEAYTRVMAIIRQHNPEFASRMAGQVAVTLRQAIQQNPNAQLLQEKVEAALAELAAASPEASSSVGSH
jgi:cobalamin biosynthesis protein CobT